MISEVLGRVTDWMGLRVNEMGNRAGNWVTGCDRKYFEVPVGPWEMSQATEGMLQELGSQSWREIINSESKNCVLDSCFSTGRAIDTPSDYNVIQLKFHK